MEDLSCPVCREEFSEKTPSRNFLAEKVIHALNILRTDKNSSIRVFPPKITRQMPDANVSKESDRFSGKEEFLEDSRLTSKSDKNNELANDNNDNPEANRIPPDESKDFSDNPIESNENNANGLAISENVSENPIEFNETEANGLAIPEENTFETEVEVYQENQDEILDIQTDIDNPEDVLPEKFDDEQTLDLPHINLKSELQPESELLL